VALAFLAHASKLSRVAGEPEAIQSAFTRAKPFPQIQGRRYRGIKISGLSRKTQHFPLEKIPSERRDRRRSERQGLAG